MLTRCVLKVHSSRSGGRFSTVVGERPSTIFVLLVVPIPILRLPPGLTRPLKQRAECVGSTAILALNFILIERLVELIQAKTDRSCPYSGCTIIIVLRFPVPADAKGFEKWAWWFPCPTRFCNPALRSRLGTTRTRRVAQILAEARWRLHDLSSDGAAEVWERPVCQVVCGRISALETAQGGL